MKAALWQGDAERRSLRRWDSCQDPEESGSQRYSNTVAWRSRSTRPAPPTRRRRIPATKCTWSSAETGRSSTGRTAIPSALATYCSCQPASSTASKISRTTLWCGSSSTVQRAEKPVDASRARDKPGSFKAGVSGRLQVDWTPVRLIYTLLLVAVTAVWGWTFVVVQDAISVYGVIPFLAVRFVLAGAALTPIYAAKLTRRSLIVGGGIGVVLAAGYLFQTTGLLFTSPTNSGLITGLFVVFAPLADRLLFGANVSRQVILAVALSLVGMILLAGGGPEGANGGDLLTLLCAAALGLHIALLSRYAASHDAGALTLAQILAMALLFIIVWPFFDSVTLPPPGVWVALLVTGLLASAGAFLVQTTVQQHIPAARTAIILTMEPVFAAMFGYWLAGDRLVAVQILGALLILSALVIGEVVPVLQRRK